MTAIRTLSAPIAPRLIARRRVVNSQAEGLRREARDLSKNLFLLPIASWLPPSPVALSKYFRFDLRYDMKHASDGENRSTCGSPATQALCDRTASRVPRQALYGSKSNDSSLGRAGLGAPRRWRTIRHRRFPIPLWSHRQEMKDTRSAFFPSNWKESRVR